MAGTPYLLLGGVGFLIYRGVKAGRKASEASDGQEPGPAA